MLHKLNIDHIHEIKMSPFLRFVININFFMISIKIFQERITILVFPYLHEVGNVGRSCIFVFKFNLQGHYSQCYFVHRHLNNACYSEAHSLNGKPYLTIIASNDIHSCYGAILKHGSFSK